MTVEKPVGRFKKGDRVPYGQYYTECVINTRDKVLSDSAFNLPIPTASVGVRERDALTSLLSQVSSSLGDAYKTLYYPAVSYSYAYIPTTKEDLKEEFKEHNWWLPTMGELARIGYYIHEYVFNAGSEMEIFTPVVENKIMNGYTRNSHYLTIKEIGDGNQAQILALTTDSQNRFYFAYNSKITKQRPALAVCAF